MGRGLLVVAGLACLVLAGCSNAPAVSGKFDEVAGDKIANEIFAADSMSLVEYAKNVRQADCMQQRGYPQLKQSGVKQNPPTFSYLNHHGPEFTRHTEDEARRFGFGQNEKSQPANVLSYDAGFDKALEKCSDEAARSVGDDYQDVIKKILKLHNDVVDERDNLLTQDAERAESEAITKVFLDCLDRKGFQQTKPGARNFDSYGVGVAKGKHEGVEPPAPKRVRGTVEVMPEVPERRYVPTPEESRLAVASVQCAKETGYGDKIADLRLRALKRVLSKHEAEIAELRPRMDELAKTAAKALGR